MPQAAVHDSVVVFTAWVGPGEATDALDEWSWGDVLSRALFALSASRKPRKRPALPLQRPPEPSRELRNAGFFPCIVDTQRGSRLARAEKVDAVLGSNVRQGDFRHFPALCLASDTTSDAGSIPRPAALTPPVARIDDGDRRPAARRSLAPTQAVAPVDYPECPSPATGASCSHDSSPRRT